MEPNEPSINFYQIKEYLDDQWYRSETTNIKHFFAECQAEWIEKGAWFLIIQAHQALTSVSQSPQTRQRGEHTKNAILSAKCQSKAAKLVVYSFIHSLFFAGAQLRVNIFIKHVRRTHKRASNEKLIGDQRINKHRHTALRMSIQLVCGRTVRAARKNWLATPEMTF
jgi:hypothetical protein